MRPFQSAARLPNFCANNTACALDPVRVTSFTSCSESALESLKSDLFADRKLFAASTAEPLSPVAR